MTVHSAVWTVACETDVAQYAEAARAALADLGPDQVDDLTDGLEANLADALADDGRARRGSLFDEWSPRRLRRRAPCCCRPRSCRCAARGHAAHRVWGPVARSPGDRPRGARTAARHALVPGHRGSRRRAASGVVGPTRMDPRPPGPAAHGSRAVPGVLAALHIRRLGGLGGGRRRQRAVGTRPMADRPAHAPAAKARKRGIRCRKRRPSALVAQRTAERAGVAAGRGGRAARGWRRRRRPARDEPLRLRRRR